MEVGIDGRALAGARVARGVAHYTSAMLDALARCFPDDDYVVLVPGSDEPPAALAAAPPAVRVRLLGVPSQVLHGTGALVGRPRVDRLLGGVDVLWAPAPAPMALSRGVPFVLTLHDLSFAERPGDFTAYERAWHALARPASRARRATCVVADSEATRSVAIARWALDPERITVVHPGVTRPARPPSAAAIAAVRKRHGIPDRYLLFVGALEPRKAPDLLARAFDQARADGLDAGLVVVGAGRLRPAMTADGLRVIGPGLKRTELEALYAGALALVAPSFNEGFGLPSLEAAACGTPSVVSDLPVFAETLGDAALTVAAGDERRLADALVRIVGDSDLRARLAGAAGRAVLRFSWEAAARELHAALRATQRS